MKKDSINLSQLCEHCDKFIKQKDQALLKSDSVFDAVFDLEQFKIECFKKCNKNNNRVYSIDEVAQILFNLFNDSCPCNYNGIDEWLPNVCEGTRLNICPDPIDPLFCWKEYLMHYAEKGIIHES